MSNQCYITYSQNDNISKRGLGVQFTWKEVISGLLHEYKPLGSAFSLLFLLTILSWYQQAGNPTTVYAMALNSQSSQASLKLLWPPKSLK